MQCVKPYVEMVDQLFSAFESLDFPNKGIVNVIQETSIRFGGRANARCFVQICGTLEHEVKI